MRLFQKVGAVLPGSRRRAAEAVAPAAETALEEAPDEARPPVAQTAVAPASPPAAAQPPSPAAEEPKADEAEPPWAGLLEFVAEALAADPPPDPEQAADARPDEPSDATPEEAAADGPEEEEPPPRPAFLSFRELSGFVGAALIDLRSSEPLDLEGPEGASLAVTAAATSEAVRAGSRMAQTLGPLEDLDEILVSTGARLHVIRLAPESPDVAVHVALDRGKANLGLARLQSDCIVKALTP